MTQSVNQVFLYYDHMSDIQNVKHLLVDNNYSALITPIVFPKFQREFYKEPMATKHTAFTRSDLMLSSSDWTNKIIAKVSDYIDCDTSVEHVRKTSERVLNQELSLANHLGCRTLIRLAGDQTVNLAKVITSFRNFKLTIMMECPMVNPELDNEDYHLDSDTKLNRPDTWTWWNKFRSYADFDPKVRLALVLSADTPSAENLRRWLGEPIELLIIPSSVFIMNKLNYPVLSKAHQEIVIAFINSNVHFAIRPAINDNYTKFYADYIRHMITTNYRSDPMRSFHDYLETPLQPLYDNLDTYTYEVFENDPIKYQRYQDAIEAALCDRVPDDKISEITSIIVVVGAGRGPLVRACLNATQRTGRKAKIYVIEKNPNAICELQAIISEMWSDRDVELFKGDMRDFKPPELADIIVSELLGSFGDNELSPECLDGAQQHLKPDGISIPCRSTSYLNPIMSSRLYNNVRRVDLTANNREHIHIYMNQAETPFVVYVKNAYNIDKPQSVFTFVHPNTTNDDNTRFKTLEYDVELDSMLTGFVGYFDSVLYKDIKVSTLPETHTPTMTSWFPIYFPIAEPMQLRAQQKLRLNFWRCHGPHRVWYEWSISEPLTTHIHNLNGRASCIYK